MRLTLFAACLALATTVLVPALAQEDIAYVSPKVPNDPNLDKVTMFRLWYVASGTAPTIALVRETKGHAPLFIEGKLQSGLFSPYVPMKPGDFVFHVLDGNVPPPKDSTEKLPLEEKKLVEPIDVTFKAGSFVTLLVQDKQGVMSARILEDKRLPAGSPPAMNVRDLSGMGDWNIRLLDRDMKLKQQLWNSSSGVPSEPIRLPGEGIYRIQVSRLINGESWQLGLFESKLSQGSLFSVILDGGGQDDHGSCRLYFDAVPGFYDAGQIKSVAEGAGAQ